MNKEEVECCANGAVAEAQGLSFKRPQRTSSIYDSKIEDSPMLMRRKDFYGMRAHAAAKGEWPVTEREFDAGNFPGSNVHR
jgi:hypothetical protein